MANKNEDYLETLTARAQRGEPAHQKDFALGVLKRKNEAGKATKDTKKANSTKKVEKAEEEKKGAKK